ncbi:hypothetical protein C4E04_13680 [Microvirga sp. 17 mud 1-3]|nr:hypothetical protein C4E04_13680 [Microvirga sp. 17 mud 1-3]
MAGFARECCCSEINSFMNDPRLLSETGEVVPGRRLSVGIVALSQIPDDPRVRRQGDAFSRAGWDVVGIGLAGSQSPPPDWPLLDESNLVSLQGGGALIGASLADPIAPLWATDERSRSGTAAPKQSARESKKDGSDSRRRAWEVAENTCRIAARYAGLGWIKRQAFRRLGQIRYVTRMQAPRLWPKSAERTFWLLNSRFGDLYSLGKMQRPDVWLANDWTALPIARRLAQESGAVLVYDTHELAADEYTEKLRWRLLHRPVTVAIERECIKEAALVTCVSDGIADRLMELYELRERPVVIRNTPSYQEMPFRGTGEIIKVLYHGIVAPGRGLEECIRSVSLWRPEFNLTIRGPALAEYYDALNRLMFEVGVQDRVSLVPAVPMVDLVREANAFDVGLFALPNHSLHNRFALPNKFFEYTMAGLALCVSDLPEMARLIKTFDHGRLFTGMDPSVIAATINSLDHVVIEQYKRRSLDAARELNWQKESERLVSACTHLATNGR